MAQALAQEQEWTRLLTAESPSQVYHSKRPSLMIASLAQLYHLKLLLDSVPNRR